MAPVSSTAVPFAATIVLLCSGFTLTQALTMSPLNRRHFFLVSSAASASMTVPALALDMDAFVQQELSKDNIKNQLSEDAALCKYGFPSQSTGEACLRAGLPTTRVAAVDAFGLADRGDFLRCKQFYEDDGQGMYVKKTSCEEQR